MWRASLKDSKNVILRQIAEDWNNCDALGNPAQQKEDIPLVVEVYPYSNPISRQAAGIQSEAAFTVIYTGPVPNANSLLIMDDKVFKMISISDYEPVQLVVADTGKTAEDMQDG